MQHSKSASIGSRADAGSRDFVVRLIAEDEAAVGGKGCAEYVAGFVGAEEDNALGDFFGAAGALEVNAGDQVSDMVSTCARDEPRSAFQERWCLTGGLSGDLEGGYEDKEVDGEEGEGGDGSVPGVTNPDARDDREEHHRRETRGREQQERAIEVADCEADRT